MSCHYDNKKIDFGERFFNHIPDLIYSEYADELISVKEIKYRYNYWIDENKLSLKKYDLLWNKAKN